MAARVNAAYYQHVSKPTGHMVAIVNPAYFQPGAGHVSPLHGRGGRKGRTKHGHAGVHGRPLPAVHDPWKHQAQATGRR